MGLSTQPEYKKVVPTLGDIRVMLETLWLRPDEIPLPTFRHRIIIHTVILMLTFGFRLGMVMDAKYGDFELAIIRDLEEAHEEKTCPHSHYPPQQVEEERIET